MFVLVFLIVILLAFRQAITRPDIPVPDIPAPDIPTEALEDFFVGQ